MDETKLKERLRQTLSDYGTNPTQLARRFDVNQKTLNNQINGNIAVSASTILLILAAFPDLSADWLLRGTVQQTGSVPADQDNDEIQRLRIENETLWRVIDRLGGSANFR